MHSSSDHGTCALQVQDPDRTACRRTATSAVACDVPKESTLLLLAAGTISSCGLAQPNNCITNARQKVRLDHTCLQAHPLQKTLLGWAAVGGRSPSGVSRVVGAPSAVRIMETGATSSSFKLQQGMSCRWHSLHRGKHHCGTASFTQRHSHGCQYAAGMVTVAAHIHHEC